MRHRVSLSEIDATLQRLGLQAIAGRVLAQQRPCLWIVLGEPGAGPVGGSRVGGDPDGAADAEWPLMPDGAPMTFVMQLALQDPALKLTGLLSLFVGAVDGGYDVPHHLRLTPPGVALQQLVPPRRSADGLFDGIAPHGLVLQPGLDFPRWDTADYQAVVAGLTEDEELAYQEDFLWSLDPADSGQILGKLLGHVAGIGSDPREDAVVWEQAPGRMYETAFTRGIRRTAGPRLHEWTNLLLVDSCRAIDLCIGDAGYMLVMAKNAKLAQGDIGQTYAQLESS